MTLKSTGAGRSRSAEGAGVPSPRSGRRQFFLFLRAVVLPFAGAAMLAGCASTRGGDIPYDVANFGQPDALSATVLDENYQIAPLDTLAVNVFQVPDLSGQYQVDLTGHIAMPLIGSVKAVDLTTVQLQKALEDKLSVSYLKNPDVTVGIAKSSGSTVTVDGAVKQAGVFPVLSKLTLVQAVAMAGGTNQDANERRVAVFRRIGGKRMAAAFDLTDIRRGKEPDPEIYRGDIIVVDGNSAKANYRSFLQSLPLASIFVPVL
jgi:polysaccharide export outer membrane protein